MKQSFPFLDLSQPWPFPPIILVICVIKISIMVFFRSEALYTVYTFVVQTLCYVFVLD